MSRVWYSMENAPKHPNMISKLGVKVGEIVKLVPPRYSLYPFEPIVFDPNVDP